MSRLSLLALLIGCSDYEVHKTGEESAGGDAVPPVEDTAVEPEFDVPVDTGDPIDTAEPVVEEPDEPVVDAPDEPVYLHTSNTLYAWDPADGVLNLVGDFYTTDGSPISGITDIAIDAAGHFYGVSWEMVYGINGHTAEVWPLGPLDSALYGLTCTSDGRLIGGGDGLVEIDPTTGETTTLVPPGRYDTSGDVVGLPDGLLYWAVRDGDDLVVVDPTSGTTSVRGVIGVQRIYGLGYSGGMLYGFTDGSQVLEIDPANGAITAEHTLPGEWWGATTNPVVW